MLGSKSVPDHDSSPLSLVREFQLLPKLFHGRKATFEVNLGECARASENECEAFSFDYGATISRSIEPIENDLMNLLLKGGPRKVFAHGELAEQFMALPEKTPLLITLKFIQGSYVTSSPIYDLEYEHDAFHTVLAQFSAKKRVVVGYRDSWEFLTGFELVEVGASAS